MKASDLQKWIDQLKGLKETIAIIYSKKIVYTETSPTLEFIRNKAECSVNHKALRASRSAPMPWGTNYQN